MSRGMVSPRRGCCEPRAPCALAIPRSGHDAFMMDAFGLACRRVTRTRMVRVSDACVRTLARVVEVLNLRE